MGMCYACSHRSERDRCRFFKFPVSPGLRKKWALAVNRRDGKSPKAKVHVLCSCHFPGQDKSKTPKLHSKSPKSKVALRQCDQDATPVVVHAAQHEPQSSPWKVDAMAAPSLSTPTEPLQSTTSHRKKRKLCKELFETQPTGANDTLDVMPLCSFQTNSSNNDLLEENEKLTARFKQLESEEREWRKKMKCAEEKVEEIASQNEELTARCTQVESREREWREKVKCAEEKVEEIVTTNEKLLARCTQMESKEREWRDKVKCAEEKVEEIVTTNEKLLARCTQMESKEREWRDKVKCLEEKVEDIVRNNEKFTAQLMEKSKKLEAEIDKFTSVSSVLKSEKEQLKLKIEQIRNHFTFKSFVMDSNIGHYTGLPNVGTFYWLLSMVPENLNYYYGCSVQVLSREDQLFLTLLKFRRNHSHQSLSDWFNVSIFTVSNIVLTWLSAVHTVLVQGLQAQHMPSLKKVQSSMPESFRKYPNCRMIFDCTEITVQVPSKMSHQNEVFSSYKHRTTFKGLVVSCPNGTIIFASPLYPGSTSDAVIVEKCGILDYLKPGDSIMADKGFLIKHLLPDGVSLNLPPFKETPQFTCGQVFETLEIARSRIHIERAIQRAKLFHILDLIPHSLFQFTSKVFQVCCALTNLRYPLIQEVEDAMRASV